MPTEVSIIRKNVIKLARKAKPVEDLREAVLTDGGRLTDFGRDVIAAAKKHGVRQALIADLFDISRSAVSQNYGKL
jgi:hypothetical protein